MNNVCLRRCWDGSDLVQLQLMFVVVRAYLLRTLLALLVHFGRCSYLLTAVASILSIIDENGVRDCEHRESPVDLEYPSSQSGIYPSKSHLSHSLDHC